MGPEHALALHLLGLILERAGHPIGEAIPMGGLYPVDRLEDHGYASLRRRRARGKDLSVLHLRPRPRRASVELQLPVSKNVADRLAEAFLGHRVKPTGTWVALDINRNSLLGPLADELTRLAMKIDR